MKIIWAWLIVKEKRILMIKRSKNKPINKYPNYWSLPWWHEDNETPEDTVKREVKEETWLDFFPTRLFIEQKDEGYHFFNFLWDFSWTIVLQEEECDWYGWFTYEETKTLLVYKTIKEILEKLHREELI